MEPEDQKNEEQGLLDEAKDATKNVAKNATKKVGKNAIKAVLAVILPKLIPLLVIILAASLIIGVINDAIDWITNFYGNDSVSAYATKEVLSEVTPTEGEDGYYYAIDQDLVDTYIKELNNAYKDGKFYQDEEENEEALQDYQEYLDEQGQEDEQTDYLLDEFTTEDLKSWFETDDFQDYVVRMIRAEIASSYPKIGNDGSYGKYGVEPTDRENGEITNIKDSNDNYKAQGIIHIRRAFLEETDSGDFNRDNKDKNDNTQQQDDIFEKSEELTYLPYDEFKELANKPDKKALKYFSFDDGTKKGEEDTNSKANNKKSQGGCIYYYTYTDVDGAFTLNENSYKIKTLSNMCSMPYNFLFALLQTSNDPEWVMAVVDQLLLESEAVLLIQDQLTTTVIKTTYSSLEQIETTTVEENGMEHKSMGTPYSVFNRDKTSTTKQNTTKVFIARANTWCLDYEQDAKSSTGTASNTETYDAGNLGDYSYFKSTINGNVTTYRSNEEYCSSVETTITSTTCAVDVSQKREISDKFLSTWKNETGKYELGAEYKADGKEIRYSLPYSKKTTSIPPDTLSDMSEYGIDLVIELLRRHDDTEIHEQLMMYYWNEYTGRNVYDVDVEALLDMFDAKTVGIGRISIHGCPLSREEFIECVKNPPASLVGNINAYMARFGQYAELIYDICMEYDINPIICVMVAGRESAYGTYVGGGWNYWGLGVYNNQNYGLGYPSLEAAIRYWCELLIKYETPGTTYYDMIVDTSTKWQEYSDKYTGGPNTWYDLWSIYAYLGDDHNSHMWGNVTAGQFIRTYLKDYGVECNHSGGAPTTEQEKALYPVYYVESTIELYGKPMFGENIFVSGGSPEAVAQFALAEIGNTGHKYIQWYNENITNGGPMYAWCATFVSYCFAQCNMIGEGGLTYPNWNVGVLMNYAREAGRFRTGYYYDPKPGDIAFDGTGHVAIVYKFDGSTTYVVDGNGTRTGSTQASRRVSTYAKYKTGFTYWEM